YLVVALVFRVFFFSSRRRHTRSKRDWSSDVCSSDLNKTFASPLAICPGSYSENKLMFLNQSSSITIFPTISNAEKIKEIPKASAKAFRSSLNKAEINNE